ncbi:MAG: nitroreductase, partial [Ilumatobacteraceae bacterium]|nr:nitroreductase [Ilumatobacteraceae bacterium]
DEPIPDEDLSAIMWHATRAPSGSNRQPTRFVVLRDGQRARRAKAVLGTSFRAGWEAKRQADGYTSGSGAQPDSPKSRAAAAMQHYVDHIEQVPAIVLACLVRYRDPSPYEGASVYPACQNLLLAARALGYGGALTLWHQPVEPVLRELLQIPDQAAISACITLGRPMGSHGPVRRRPARDVVFDDGWDQPAHWVTEPAGAEHSSWSARGH